MVSPSLSAPADSSIYRRWRWQIFFITWLAYAGFYLTRKSFAVAKIGIGKDPILHMTDWQMSWIDSVNLTAYAIGQFVSGMVGDKVGPRRVVLTGMIGSVIAAVAMGASQITVMLGILFCIQGLCQSCGWAPLSKNMSEFFSRRERGVVMGWWCTNYAIGGFIASAIAGWAADRWGWRYAFYVPAVGLAFVAILFWLLQKNRPEDTGLVSIEEYHGEPPEVLIEGERPEEVPEGSWKTIGEVLTNRMVLMLSAVYFLLKPARYAILFWGPKFVNARLGTNMTQSALVSAMFELAGPAGALAGGYLSDKVFGSRRMPVCVVSLFLLSGVLFSFNSFPASKVVLSASLFLIGFLLFAPDTLIIGAAAADFGTKKGASTASGVINGFGSVGAVLGGALPGFLNQRWGWSGVFNFFAFMVFLSAVILLPQWNATPAAAKAKERRGFEVVAERK
jgi:OPA family glycerol-3-phosphate transporter-like MFS transporter